MTTGTILEVSSAKIGSYLACMHGFIYAWYIGPSYIYSYIQLTTKLVMAMISCCMIMHEVEFRLVYLINVQGITLRSCIARTLHMQLCTHVLIHACA